MQWLVVFKSFSPDTIILVLLQIKIVVAHARRGKFCLSEWIPDAWNAWNVWITTSNAGGGGGGRGVGRI